MSASKVDTMENEKSLPAMPIARSAEETTEIASKILEIVFEYALTKFDGCMERLGKGMPKFLFVVENFVRDNRKVKMCLPAFPFKSANKIYKVLGSLPDKAEELSLARLNTMCTRIGEIYSPGAKLTIISDGLVYNDLLSISDRETWAYGQALRAMAIEKGFTNIDFSRIRDLVKFPCPEKMEEITYVANATNFRRYLFNLYGKDDLDIEHEIKNNPDTAMTYLGYRRFLESDLKHIFPVGKDRSMKSYKNDVRYLAKQMLIRGYAFAGACKAAFPNHLRLSIHQSTGEHKVSMSLLHTKTGFTTPWHCSVALMANGEWISAPMGDFKEDPRLEIVYEDGRPSFFRQRNRESQAVEDVETKALTKPIIENVETNSSDSTGTLVLDRMVETNEKGMRSSISSTNSSIKAGDLDKIADRVMALIAAREKATPQLSTTPVRKREHVKEKKSWRALLCIGSTKSEEAK